MQILQQYGTEIVNELGNAIHHDINIMDQHGEILASTNAERIGTLHQGASRLIHEGLTSLTIYQNDPVAGVQRGINLPITVNGELFGVIGITGEPDEVSIFADIIKLMTETSIEGILQKEELEKIGLSQKIFLENWLFHELPDWADLELRGKLLGFEIHTPYTVALLDSAEHSSLENRPEHHREIPSELILRITQNLLPKHSNYYSTVVNNKVIVLFSNISRNEIFSILQQICQNIESSYGLIMCGGISDYSTSAQDIRRCYQNAKAALNVARTTGQQNLMFYGKITFDFIIQTIPSHVKSELRTILFLPVHQRKKANLPASLKSFLNITAISSAVLPPCSCTAIPFSTAWSASVTKPDMI